MKITVYAPGKNAPSQVIDINVAEGVTVQDFDAKTKKSIANKIEKHFDQHLKGAWYKTVAFGEGGYVGKDTHEEMRDELELIEFEVGDRTIYTDDEDALEALFGVEETTEE